MKNTLWERMLTARFIIWLICIILFSFVNFTSPGLSYAYICVFIAILLLIGNPLLPKESREEQMSEFSLWRVLLWCFVVISYPFFISYIRRIYPEYSENIISASVPIFLGFVFFFRNPFKSPLTKQY